MIYDNLELLINEVKDREIFKTFGKITIHPNAWETLMNEIKVDENKMNSFSAAGILALTSEPYRYKGYLVKISKNCPINRLVIGLD